MSSYDHENLRVGRLPAGVDLVLYAGDDFDADVSVIDPLSDTPVDLTGAAAAAQIRESLDAAAALVAFACTVEGNVVRLHLDHEQTATLPALAYWDVEVVDPAGRITTLAYGKVRTTAEVTR